VAEVVPGPDHLTFPWLNISSPDYHAIAHQDAGGYPTKIKIDQWEWRRRVSRAPTIAAVVAHPRTPVRAPQRDAA
jgi:hypothetical protein